MRGQFDDALHPEYPNRSDGAIKMMAKHALASLSDEVRAALF